MFEFSGILFLEKDNHVKFSRTTPPGAQLFIVRASHTRCDIVPADEKPVPPIVYQRGASHPCLSLDIYLIFCEREKDGKGKEERRGEKRREEKKKKEDRRGEKKREEEKIEKRERERGRGGRGRKRASRTLGKAYHRWFPLPPAERGKKR